MGIEYTIGQHGGGVHQWNTVFSDVRYVRQVGFTTLVVARRHSYATQWSNYSDMVCSVSLTFVMLSILLLILRIFLSVWRDPFWWLAQFLVGLNTVFYSMNLLIAVFLCSPRTKFGTRMFLGTASSARLHIFLRQHSTRFQIS